ncbi:MAG: sugar ABC transporter permease, partial [Gammaproteobacteria bacterium]|nr:sugar ABC transporter permease [Gammaproteobacteria bacterium]
RTGSKAISYLVIMSIPLMIPWVVVGLTWAMLIHPQWGSIGAILSLVGITINMNNPIIAWMVILIVDIWHWTSLIVLLCYSGLIAIPQQYYQAAKVDGAPRWAILRHIELPKLKKVLLIAILLRFIDSFMIYVEPLILTKGGPGTSTVFISHDLMRNAAQQFDLGRSAAISLIYFAIILAITWVIYRAMNPKLSQS